MLALKRLMEALGSPNLDCRQDGAKLDPGQPRRLPLQCRPSPGIDEADAILIVGSNPRLGSAGAERPHPQALAAGQASGGA